MAKNPSTYINNVAARLNPLPGVNIPIMSQNFSNRIGANPAVQSLADSIAE